MGFKDNFTSTRKDFDLKLVEQQSLFRDDSGSYRKYKTPNGDIYPSITTVLGASPDKKEFLKEWTSRVGPKEAKRISKKAANNGTRVHDALEFYVKGGTVSDSNYQFRQIKKILDTHVNNIHGIELSLYSDIIKLAGTTDLIAEFDNELSIIDYKTSRNNKREEWIIDYFIQSTFYAYAFEEMYGIKIKQIVIIISIENGHEAQIFIKKRKDYAQNLIDARKYFEKVKDD